jgi:hypothetical protein
MHQSTPKSVTAQLPTAVSSESVIGEALACANELLGG